MTPAARAGSVTDEQRLVHDRHRHWVPAVVLAVLCVFALLPDVVVLLGAEPLDDYQRNPSFDVGPRLQRQMLFLLAALGFLSAYYLPLAHKKTPVVILTILGLGWLGGPAPVSVLLAWHVAAYGIFHAPPPLGRVTLQGVLAASALVWVPSAWSGQHGPFRFVVETLLTAFAVAILYALVLHPLLRRPAGRAIQAAMAHVSLIYIAVMLVWNLHHGIGSKSANLAPYTLFFWQWERLVMYRIDLRDGRVPRDLSFLGYLATFLSPAFLSNMSWLNRIPKGYAYLADSFLARDKNRIALSGIRLIALSFLFFYVHAGIVYVRRNAESLGLDLPVSYDGFLRATAAGHAPGIGEAWFTLLYAFLGFYTLWTAVAHLRVGLWRLFGYDIEPHFQRPFASTNLLEWWRRYSYYYREFLVQAFYLPVFLRFFRGRPYLRVMTATLAAAGGGNLVFHLLESALYRRSTAEVWMAQLRTLPYYLLLGAAIGLTQIWILKRGRRRRRPWTGGWRVIRDVPAMLGTVGFFILIRPFHHVPLDHSVADAFRVILAALGLSG